MSETLQLIIGIILLLGVFIGSRYIVAWRIKRSAAWVLKDLYQRGALDAESAVELPYAQKQWLRIGLRDFRPKALESLFNSGIVSQNEEGRFFIWDKNTAQRFLEMQTGYRP